MEIEHEYALLTDKNYIEKSMKLLFLNKIGKGFCI